MVCSNKNKLSLPFNANLGFVHPQSPADKQVFQHVVDHTEDQLASSWLQFAESVQNKDFYFPPLQDLNGKELIPLLKVRNSRDSYHYTMEQHFISTAGTLKNGINQTSDY